MTCCTYWLQNIVGKRTSGKLGDTILQVCVRRTLSTIYCSHANCCGQCRDAVKRHNIRIDPPERLNQGIDRLRTRGRPVRLTTNQLRVRSFQLHGQGCFANTDSGCQSVSGAAKAVSLNRRVWCESAGTLTTMSKAPRGGL